MIKIAITGPECSGKTTLADKLAAHYHTCWVPEYARTYLERLDRPYQEEDLLEIAKGQSELESAFSSTAGKYLITDTDFTVLYIWSMVRYGRVNPWIEKQFNNHDYHLYLLMYPDLPWEFDPQREHPQQREFLYHQYFRLLKKSGKPFRVIRGQDAMKLETAVFVIDKFFG
jgi:NadR type nicotinamide-nucleotide adenylyltransferase